MRIENYLTSAQFYLDNIGHCRFSAFYSHSNKDRAVLIEMTARVVVGTFAVFSLYDLATRSLPMAVKVLVHGSILAILTSLCLSVLLKKLLPAPDKLSEEDRKGELAHTLSKEEALENLVHDHEDDKLFSEARDYGTESSYKPHRGPLSPPFLEEEEVEEDESPFSSRKVERNLIPEFEEAAKEP